MKSTFFASALLIGSLQALEVHEWGTFTVLCGANGTQVPWYQPFGDLAALPPFVHPGFFGKEGAAIARMETPVIYFYPEKEMKVTVAANLESGSITETFPYGSLEPVVGPGFGLRWKASWTGTLHPPTDPRALGLIPAITPSAHQEPYGAAREVPDAWIFESDLKQKPGVDKPFARPEADKFIFYRGAGRSQLSTSATLTDSSVTLQHAPIQSLRYAVVLRVRGNQAGWAVIPAAAVVDQDSKTSYEVSVELPQVNRPLDEVEAELAAAWKQALAANGLTAPEASAMVETWRKTWFREHGDRVLTLMPRAEVDAMLPLSITPAPAKLERAFVARLEIISTDRAEGLAAAMESGLPQRQPVPVRSFPGVANESVLIRASAVFVPDLMGPPPSAQALPQDMTQALGESFALQQLEALKLGRFENGAIEIAIAQRAQAMRAAFYSLALRRMQVQAAQAAGTR